MRRAGKADTPAAAHPPHGLTRFEPQALAREQIRAVEGPVDVECGAQAARTPAKIACVLRSAPAPHEFETFDRLERTNEHARSFTIAFAREIEAVRRSVYEVDVGTMRRPEEGRVAHRLSNIGVTRGISGKVCLGFDDSSRDESLTAFAQ